MKKRLSFTLLTTLAGVALAVLTLRLSAASPVGATSSIRYVATTGGDSSNNCTSPSTPCKTIQHAIDVATSGDEIRVAGGTYTRNGTLAAITKELSITGAYDPAFTAPDPDFYETVLDAQWGGSVISMTNAGNVILLHLTLTHGNGTGSKGGSNGYGGGLYSQGTNTNGTNLSIGYCVITNNLGTTSGLGYGGGIYYWNPSNFYFEMWNSQVLSNTASKTGGTSRGGGVYAGTGVVLLSKNQIQDNTGCVDCSGLGGGIHLQQVSHAEVLTNVIQGNDAAVGSSSGYGGGISLFSCGSVTIAGNRIEFNGGNSFGGGGRGGGIYVVDCRTSIDRNTIASNVAGDPGWGWEKAGGGIYIYSQQQPVTLSNNLIVQNDSGVRSYPYNHAGDGLHVYRPELPASRVVLVNNTIADNHTLGIDLWGYVNMVLTNTLISGHPAGITSTTPASVTFSANTNLFWNTSDLVLGANPILADPLLWPDYHPRQGSPAVNAGLTIPWLTVDLDGNHRPKEGIYDIGAYEGIWRKVFLPLLLR